MNFFRSFSTKASLDSAYSPSRHVPDISFYLREYERRSAQARDALGSCQTFQYGASRAERLDLFVAPAAGAVSDTVVFIHGGYWQELSKDHHSFPASAFNAAGVNFAAIGYGLAPQLKPAAMTSQCRTALEWLTTHAGGLSIGQSLHLIGHSAGAQLAAMTVLMDRRLASREILPIRSVTTISGVFDLRPIALTYVNDVLRLSEEEALLGSPLLRVDFVQRSLPSFRLAYAEFEPSEFARQSQEFAAALAAKGADVEVSCLDDRNHFDIILDLGDPDSSFFQSVLRHISARRVAQERPS